jgi:hypothetical protein
MKFFKILIVLSLVAVFLSKRSRNKKSSKSRSHTQDFKVLEKYGEPSVRVVHPGKSSDYTMPAPEQSHKVMLLRKEEGVPSLCLKFVTPYDYVDKYFYDNINEFLVYLGDASFCLDKQKVEKVSVEKDGLTVKIEVFNNYGDNNIEYNLIFEADSKATKPLNALFKKQVDKINIAKINSITKNGIKELAQQKRQNSLPPQ